MKLSPAVTGIIALLVTASCPAITLKLDPQIDLLVLDGRKIAGSLLKGADSLELEQGQHQFLFRVEKPCPDATHFQSVPMIVTFTAEAHSVAIHLPSLNSRRERSTFNKLLNFRLIDEQGTEIASLRDRLPQSSSGDMMQAMMAYNRAAQTASVLRFAAPSATAVSENPDFAWQDASDLPSIQRWFKRFDAATRQKLLSWMKTLRTS